jgi:RNA polymerase sigma-70 factor (ECF subfamily)
MEPASAVRRERFDALVEACDAKIVAYVRRRAPEAVVEDVVGETFLVTWRQLERVPDDPLPWLYGVARRVLANERRGRRRRTGLAARIAFEHRAPELPVFAAQVSEAVREALLALSPREREAILLVAWEDLSADQGAVAAGCTAAAFRVRLHRARRHLVRALGPDFQDAKVEPADAAKEACRS